MTTQPLVHLERQAGISVLTIDHPPVNSLGSAMRRALLAAITAEQPVGGSRDGTRAIVITGAGRNFSGGADVAEFGADLDPDAPDLNDVLAAIEGSSIPVVAAIRGVAYGGALELALACHGRVARADARLALPEVKLGLIPGAGGTQRLPRLVGLGRTAEMVALGEPISGELALTAGLVDMLDDDAVAAGIVLACRIADAQQQLRRSSALPVDAGGLNELGVVRARLPRRLAHMTASQTALDVIALGVQLGFEAGLRLEHEAFLELLDSESSKALRHLFFAERAARRVADDRDAPRYRAAPIRDTPERRIASIGVVGAGTMGSGIAMVFANAGLPVILTEQDDASLERGMARIRSVYERASVKAEISTAERTERSARITGSTSLQALAECDLIVEAVFEDMDVKRTVFTAIDAVAKPGAILASNTSALDIDVLARATRRPADVLGLHFFSPAHVTRLLEIVRGTQTDPAVLAAARQLAERTGKVAVVVKMCDGFCANRLLYPYLRQVDFLLEEGALPQDIDRALTGFGLAMGPCAMIDMAGQDVAHSVRQQQLAHWPARRRYSLLSDMLVQKGHLGVKSGMGWYRYDASGRTRTPDPDVEQMIVAESRRLGLRRRPVSDAEIVERCVLALINEGAFVVEEGIVARAGDIDLCFIHGMGFPASRGGPMFHADTLGLRHVVDRIDDLARAGDTNWKMSPLLRRLAQEGRSFTHGP